ncbi:MAG: hypothetical protein KGD58_16305 [Candidatus Lokiarchaeota archaeon]|nr:hypothetical protein [Candidatus Lokiarchaeota archaeon]
MEEKKLEKGEIFNSFIEYEKKFFPKLHKKKIDKKIDEKNHRFGDNLAKDFLENVREEVK